MIHHPEFLRIRAERDAAIREQKLARLAHRCHLAYSWVVSRVAGLAVILLVAALVPVMVVVSRSLKP